MNTASMNNEAPTSFFAGHEEEPTATKFKETKAEKPFVDASESLAVKEFKMDPATFEGMSKTTVTAVTFVSCFVVGYLVGFIIMSLVMMLAFAIGTLTASTILPVIIAIGGFIGIMFGLEWLTINITVPLSKVVITAYSWIHRKVKSLFNSKK